MVEWELSFRESEPLTVDLCAHALGGVATGPLSTVLETISGDAREGFSRVVRIAAPCGEAHVELAVMQCLYSEEPESDAAESRLINVAVRGPIAAKLAAWQRMTGVFGRLGWADTTLTWRPAPIVDELETSGDLETAARLRQGITEALVANAAMSLPWLTLLSTRADIDSVLAACDCERLKMIVLTDCKLSGLPAGITRFARLESLSVTDDAIDGNVFRGTSLPSLTRLHVGGDGLRSLARDDVDGLPSLVALVVFGTPLETLDPAIIEVCPNLRRVQLDDTPLARDPHKLAALRACWPGVSVE